MKRKTWTTNSTGNCPATSFRRSRRSPKTARSTTRRSRARSTTSSRRRVRPRSAVAGVEAQEYQYLSDDERRLLIRETIAMIDGRVPALVGVSHASYRTSIKLAEYAQRTRRVGGAAAAAEPPVGRCRDDRRDRRLFRNDLDRRRRCRSSRITTKARAPICRSRAARSARARQRRRAQGKLAQSALPRAAAARQPRRASSPISSRRSKCCSAR